MEKFNKEEFLNIKQVNDLLNKFKNKENEEKNHKCMTWVWITLGIATVAAGAFALYKLLAPKEFDDFEEEDDFEEFEEFEEEDYQDMEYEDNTDNNDETEATQEEVQSEE
ncbi:MAG: DUF4366 domain-containing protein [Vallitalea sp.]|nr:DUF4366 domain-containing protein [Vallitalea sp.]